MICLWSGCGSYTHRSLDRMKDLYSSMNQSSEHINQDDYSIANHSETVEQEKSNRSPMDRVRLQRKTGLSPQVIYYWPFQGDASVVVCSKRLSVCLTQARNPYTTKNLLIWEKLFVWENVSLWLFQSQEHAMQLLKRNDITTVLS